MNIGFSIEERWQLIEARFVPANVILLWLEEEDFRRYVADRLGGQVPEGRS